MVQTTNREKRDRYGRYLAGVIHEDRGLSDYLLEIGATKRGSRKLQASRRTATSYPAVNLRHEGPLGYLKHPHSFFLLNINLPSK